MPLGDLLRSAAQIYGDRDAVVYAKQPEIGDIRWSFSELDMETTKLAAGLLGAGMQPGEKVGVWFPNHPEWLLLQWAIAKAGLVIVTLSPLYKERELKHALTLAEVAWIFCLDELGSMRPFELVQSLRPSLPSLRGVFAVGRHLHDFMSGGDLSVSLPSVRRDSLCMIQFTSGTTGTPKGVQLSHANLIETATAVHRVWKVKAGDRLGHGFPLFHIGGSGVLSIGSVIMGSATLPMRIFDAGRALDIIETERCTAFLAVPTMYIRMMEVNAVSPRDLTSLGWLSSGGSVMKDELRHEIEHVFGAPVLNVYGQTETGGLISSGCSDEAEEIRGSRVGRPLPGVTVKAVDSSGTEVPNGQPGELWYHGPGGMIGYIGDARVGDGPSGDWIATGDRGLVHEDGTLSIIGRATDMIIRGGENISPAETEEVIREMAGVAEVAIVGVPDETYGEEICAFVRLDGTRMLAEEEVRSHCAVVLSRWKVPRFVFFTDGFPTTPSGKIQKFILREEAIKKLEGGSSRGN
jgi:fatty-acyl-CoA synthase